MAWCIVPFDAKKRGPAERAEMLKGLGLKRVAYDWREQHVKEFEEEILQYKKHGLEFFAFWGVHDEAFALFEKYKLHPQIWLTLPSPKAETQEARVAAAAARARRRGPAAGREPQRREPVAAGASDGSGTFATTFVHNLCTFV